MENIPQPETSGNTPTYDYKHLSKHQKNASGRQGRRARFRRGLQAPRTGRNRSHSRTSRRRSRREGRRRGGAGRQRRPRRTTGNVGTHRRASLRDFAERAHLARCCLYSPVAAAAYLARLRSMGEPCRRDGVGELARFCHGKRHVAHAQCSGPPERCQFYARAVRSGKRFPARSW